MEARLREVWAAILKVPVESIGRDDSFLRIGGDSITAIQVVGRAQEAGTALTVKDIFDDPRLAAVAAKASDMEGGLGSLPGLQVEPFSLLPGESRGVMLAEVHTECGLTDDQEIEDAYPCSALQEGLMALAVKQPDRILRSSRTGSQRTSNNTIPGSVGADVSTVWQSAYTYCPRERAVGAGLSAKRHALGKGRLGELTRGPR